MLNLVIRGDAVVIDVGQPLDFTTSALDAAMTPLGLASFLVKRRTEVTRIVPDVLSGQLTSASQRRVLVSVQPDECEVLEAAPQEAAALAWVTNRGMVTVPVEWDGTGGTAYLGPGALDLEHLAGSRQSAAAAIDRYGRPGMGAEAMFGGSARLSEDNLRMEVERITCWEAERVCSRVPR